MSVKNNKILLQRLTEALNSRDLDAVDEIFTPDYVRHDPSGLLHEAGIEEYKRAFSAILAAFPDAKWAVEEILENGDRIIGRFSFQGTHDGPFFNIGPTGKKVTYPIIGIYRIEEGRIAEDWHIFHALGLWQTLIPEIKNLIDEARG
jgi:predicted ester cyclase